MESENYLFSCQTLIIKATAASGKKKPNWLKSIAGVALLVTNPNCGNFAPFTPCQTYHYITSSLVFVKSSEVFPFCNVRYELVQNELQNHKAFHFFQMDSIFCLYQNS